MKSVGTGLIGESDAALAALACMSTDVAEIQQLSDVDLQVLAIRQRDILTHAGARGALIAGEIARRSAVEKGKDGLAQKLGYRTPEQMVKTTTGVTGSDAVAAVNAGRVIVETAGLPDPETGVIEPPKEPWLAVVGEAVRDGRISDKFLGAIRTGLGRPKAEITVAMLGFLAAQLVEEATDLTYDQVIRRAKELRDELDSTRITDREALRRANRGLRYFGPGANGMSKIVWDMDPETDAPVKALIDRLTSPKRGGPRFVDPAEQEKADRIADDDRTVEQLASDGLLHLLEARADADDSQLLGSGGPVVKYTVVQDDYEAGTGVGRIEGNETNPVSQETLERLVCTGATEVVTVDLNLNPIDVGYLQRLFSAKQKSALAVRDGGCMWPGCDRPPSWTEAHHAEHHHKGGKTTVENGILLCRFHHLLLHNNHWNITRDLYGWWLIPPVDIDPQQVPRPMPSKSLAWKDLRRHRDHRREKQARDVEAAEQARLAEQARQAEDARKAEEEWHDLLVEMALQAALDRHALHRSG